MLEVMTTRHFGKHAADERTYLHTPVGEASHQNADFEFESFVADVSSYRRS